MGMQYKYDQNLLRMSKKVLEVPSLVDDKIERYFGEYLAASSLNGGEDGEVLDVEKCGKGMTISRYEEVHEGWYENGEQSGHGRLI